MRPHRWQPTRLRHPWDSPGKNTGVGCHFLLQCMKVKSESEVAQSCPTLRDSMDCSLPGSSVYGIFQARVLEWGAIAFSVPWYSLVFYFNYFLVGFIVLFGSFFVLFPCDLITLFSVIFGFLSCVCIYCRFWFVVSMRFILIHSSLYIGEGNGNPLQYSCLETPMDGGAW